MARQTAAERKAAEAEAAAAAAAEETAAAAAHAGEDTPQPDAPVAAPDPETPAAEEPKHSSDGVTLEVLDVRTLPGHPNGQRIVAGYTFTPQRRVVEVTADEAEAIRADAALIIEDVLDDGE